jgi:hypothetical protein
MKTCLTLLLTLSTSHASPAVIKDGELVPAASSTEVAPIDPTNAPHPDVTAFLKKCRKKCDNLDNLPVYMKNHATSEEHCYLGCSWGYQMLCAEIGCGSGVGLHVPEPAKKPELLPTATGATGSSATGSSATGGEMGVEDITGGTEDDVAEHVRSVEGVVNGWKEEESDDTLSETGATGSASGTLSGTGGATGSSKTGGATGDEASSATDGPSLLEMRTSMLLSRNQNARKHATTK